MNDTHNRYKYASRRNSVYGKNGMVASSSPLASQAGLEILKKGGNAIDAAIATAAMLTVVEPTANGIGGDLFALFHHNGQLHGLNASGHAPKLMSIDNIKNRGFSDVPLYGLEPITVPGVPKGWAILSEKFGILPFDQLMEPAAIMAETGFVLSGFLARMFNKAHARFKQELTQYPLLETWFHVYTKGGKTPQAGEILVVADQARTLREIGETHANSFYNGSIADEIDRFSRSYDGFIRKEDLMAFTPEFVTPLSTHYRGYEIWELPPNGIGIITLMALNILETFKLRERDSDETYHRLIESLKLAFSDGNEYIGDINYMKADIFELISKKHARRRAKLVEHQAIMPTHGQLLSSDTVYLATADASGNMVSLIQSCYTDFGSGIVLPNRGIVLQNRGTLFSLNEESPNALQPGKKPYHTIIPGFITKNDLPIGPFGIMGGTMQPQAHLQIISNLIDYQMNPQEALDAPRWRWIEGKKVNLEKSTEDQIIEGLISRGHEVSISAENIEFGRGQIILRNEHGALIGGTEPRTDGHIAVW